MRALSVKQPWANLIAAGDKTIETRTWATEYRGELIIVSTKSPKIPPAGFALAVVRLGDCRPMTERDEPEACCRWYPEAFSWVLDDIRKLRPVPMKGQLGLYDVDLLPAFVFEAE